MFCGRGALGSVRECAVAAQEMRSVVDTPQRPVARDTFVQLAVHPLDAFKAQPLLLRLTVFNGRVGSHHAACRTNCGLVVAHDADSFVLCDVEDWA